MADTALNIMEDEETEKSIDWKKKKQNSLNIIHLADDINFSGEMVGKIISARHYAFEEAGIMDLADALLVKEDVFAVGVVNKNREVVGVISRKDLFDELGKPFGRDLYHNKTITYIMDESKTFTYNRNLLSVSQEISHTFHSNQNRFYVIVDQENRFVGIFTNKDMLIYMSDLTQKDILLAKKLQSGIVKDKHWFETDYMEVLGSSTMAKGIGGDYYGMQNYTKGQWLFSICDVSGKGVSASLVSVLIGGMTTVYDFKQGISPFLKMMNSYLLKSFENEKFVTGIFMDLNEKTGDVTIFDMGHAYSFIYRNHKMIKLTTPNAVMPMGITDEFTPRGGQYQLQKGDLLVLMTDGFEEQKNMTGEEYGLSRMFKIIHKNAGRDLLAIRNALYSDIHFFRGGHPQQDDMTLILLKYRD